MAKNVLIVDDNLYHRQIFTTVLGFYGYQISEAATGARAIQKALSEKPSLILMDLVLPDMSGTAVTRVIKADPLTVHIPIVGCSAFLGSEWRERALAAGMVAYFLKPMSADLINAIIQKFILPER